MLVLEVQYLTEELLIAVGTLMVLYRCTPTPTNHVITSTTARFTVVLSPGFRSWMLWSDGSKWEHVTSATRNGGVGDSHHIHLQCDHLRRHLDQHDHPQYGDWFLLKQIHKNTDPETFNEFLKLLETEEDWAINSNSTTM